LNLIGYLVGKAEGKGQDSIIRITGVSRIIVGLTGD